MDKSIFETDRIIFFVYPVGASGKFVTNCLSFNDSFYPQFRASLRNVQNPIGKMRLIEYALEHYIEKKKKNPATEWLDINFGDHEFFGHEYFDEPDKWKTLDSYKETILNSIEFQLSTLINQNLYFFKVLHFDYHYEYYTQLWPNAKKVFMINCFNWVESRKPSTKWNKIEKIDVVNLENAILFDTNSLFHWDMFLKEYKNLLGAFDKKIQNVDRLEKFYHRYMYAINL